MVPKGQKDTIKAHASAQGESVNGFIGRAISETMERDGSGNPLVGVQETAGASTEPGAVSLLPDTLKAAREAAQAAGEGLPQFLDRAVATQAQRDALERKMRGGS